MKKTVIEQAITMVRSRMESMDETLMGKHTIHHLQQIERDLYNLVEKEKEQIQEAYMAGESDGDHYIDSSLIYYNETYNKQ
jgi:hypothetical protein